MAKASGGTRQNSRLSIGGIVKGETAAPVIVGKVPGNAIAAYFQGNIYISKETEDAIKRLLNGTGNEDDMLKLEELLHEIGHAQAHEGKLKQISSPDPRGQDSVQYAMEVMNEIRAREMLADFARKNGIEPLSVDYSKRGARGGYNNKIAILNKVIDALGADKVAVYRDIAQSKEHSVNSLAGILSKHSKLNTQDAQRVVKNIYGNWVEWDDERRGFDGKIKSREGLEKVFGVGSPNIKKPYDYDIAFRIIKQKNK